MSGFPPSAISRIPEFGDFTILKSGVSGTTIPGYQSLWIYSFWNSRIPENTCCRETLMLQLPESGSSKIMNF
jgi:hypothetical protein